MVTSITLDWIVSGGDICVNSRTFSNKMDWCEMSLSFWPSILIVWGSGLNEGLPKLVSSNNVWFATPSAYSVNTLWPGQDGRHYPDDIFKYIFLNKIKNAWILITISSKFVPKGIINNIPSSDQIWLGADQGLINNIPSVQIMTWHRSGDNPLSGPMMASFADAYMRHSSSMSLIAVDHIANRDIHWSLVPEKMTKVLQITFSNI